MRLSVRSLAILALLLGTAVASAQTIQPPYNASYTLADLGAVPGLPAPYGGLAFLPSNPNVIVIGGAANSASGALYSIGVVRGAGSHITGFTGSAVLHSAGEFNDGGVVFGPGGVLFYTRYPVNEIGQIEPGSTVNDRIIGLTALGITSSVGALNFVPGGFPGAGQLKIVSYNTGDWYTASYSADGAGTFNITAPVLNTTIDVGPEGFIYVPLGSPIFPSGTSMLVSEYGNDVVATYQIDAGGNPIPASRAVFVDGLAGAEGAVIDPVTGDFLFSTFGASNRVIAVRGFGIPPTPTFTPVVGQPTATPTQTPTVPAPTATQTPTRTPTVPAPTATQTPTTLGPAPVVPTLSFPMLALLGLMLAGTGFWLMMRRN